MKYFIFLFLIFPAFTGRSQLIEGTNREYAGKKLQFFSYPDPVTQEKTRAFTIDIDQNGNFSVFFPVTQTAFVFCDFGIYRGMLFLEKGMPVKLLLPPFREKSFADKKNPYFKPVEFWFATEGGNRLTDLAGKYDSRLNELTDQLFNSLYFNQSKPVFDSVANTLEQQFKTISGDVFQWHKKLKLKAIEVDVFRLPATNSASAFQGIRSEFWTHPAFIQLFEKTFTNLLSFEARSLTGNSVNRAVAAGDILYIKKIITDKYKLSGPVADIVMLKLLHDAYYSGDFSQDDILKLTASGYFTANPGISIRTAAGRVHNKLMHLRKGSKAPVICLKNTDGNNFCSQNDSQAESGKFKYLVFADTEMIVCREHLKYLTQIQELFSNHLEIIIVLKKTDLIEMKMFLVKQKIPGIHLIDEGDFFIENYRVKSFPMCFLLNQRHEVVFQHTLAPLDGFEQQFGEFLRRELFESQRN